MTLKKNEIDEKLEKYIDQMKDTDLISKRIEEVSQPMFLDRVERYAKLMSDVRERFYASGFNAEESLEMTKIVLQYILNSGNAQMPQSKGDTSYVG